MGGDMQTGGGFAAPGYTIDDNIFFSGRFYNQLLFCRTWNQFHLFFLWADASLSSFFVVRYFLRKQFLRQSRQQFLEIHRAPSEPAVEIHKHRHENKEDDQINKPGEQLLVEMEVLITDRRKEAVDGQRDGKHRAEDDQQEKVFGQREAHISFSLSREKIESSAWVRMRRSNPFRMLSFLRTTDVPVPMPHHGKVLFADAKSHLCLIKIRDLEREDWENWRNNRPPDPVRVAQISNYFSVSNETLVPGIIHAWVRGSKFLVFDGAHRLHAAFASGRDMSAVVRYYDSDREQDIIEEFTNINKSVSVPYVYLEQDNYVKRTVCLSIVEHLCKKYPSFLSPSRNHYSYNFNRDKMMDFISELQIDFTKPSVDKIIILELDGLNVFAGDYVSRNNIRLPKKCTHHGVFLFVLFHLNGPLIRDRLEKAARG